MLSACLLHLWSRGDGDVAALGGNGHYDRYIFGILFVYSEIGTFAGSVGDCKNGVLPGNSTKDENEYKPGLLVHGISGKSQN